MSKIKIHGEGTELRPLAKLIPYARNSRKHTEASTEAMVRGLREFGWTYPVLIDPDGGVIAGHGRILAAEKLGMKEVPVLVARGWTKEQKAAYVIWDNKSAELSTFDFDMLRAELLDLREGGFDLGLTGFATEELSDLFKVGGPGRADPDYLPPVPAVPVSQLGDVWLLGKHRLACGDCTDPAAVALALNGHKPHLMVTDPPYGVEYDPSWRTEVSGGKGFSKSGTSVGEVMNDDRADWREAWALFPGDVAYVWFGSLAAPAVGASLEAKGFVLRSLIIWNKQLAPMSRGNYHWKHEPCWYAVRKGGTAHWNGDRKQTTVWDIQSAAGYLQSEDKFKTGHGTQKPIECMRRPIENNSKPGDRIYEPFNGSGSTLIAAHMTKRICHAVEISPVYVDVAVARWQAFTGEVAFLEETGETMEEVTARREQEEPAPAAMAEAV